MIPTVPMTPDASPSFACVDFSLLLFWIHFYFPMIRRLVFAAVLLVSYVSFLRALQHASLPRAPPSEAGPPALRVRFGAPFLSGSGIGRDAYLLAAALHRANVSLLVYQHGDTPRREFVDGLPGPMRRALRDWSHAAASGAELVEVSLCSSEPGAWSAPVPRYRTADCPWPGAPLAAARFVWELEAVPDGWLDRLRFMRRLWVPSRFGRQQLLDAGFDPAAIDVVPEPVDAEAEFFPWRPSPDSPVRPSLDALLPAAVARRSHPGFTFLSVHKFERRKGWDLLVDAFVAEFALAPGRAAAADAPRLVIVTSEFHHDGPPVESVVAERVKRATPEGAVPPEVVVSSAFVPQNRMRELYQAADAFVLATRGEGWGLPLVEAMACGLPVISTQWAGPADFMTDDIAFPVPVEVMETVPDGPFRGNRWARPDGAALRRRLRQVASDPAHARDVGARARAAVRERYSLERVGRIAAEALERLRAHV
jgi:glycosyltransferase involved in cell wall biosynthesis